MQGQRYYYLIELQYLGFRYHGFQKQPNVKTVQLVLERTLNYVLGHKDHKVLPSGRTDAMVSANQAYIELFVKEQLDEQVFLKDFNHNLPSDVRAMSIEQVDAKFNVILNPKIKEYLYLFSFGEKNHPFAAPYICHINDHLDIEQMKKGAQLFQGRHNFQNYVYKPSEMTVLEREVVQCELVNNDIYTASFFPKQSYMLRVCGPGFMRHQVRLMAGALINLGRGVHTMEELELSLTQKREEPFTFIAPASGLILNSIKF
ncbi:tRNA pseudouridine(38-40) synthase TruA [Reichenbachiella sp. MSK19-1]|uniref:tRNA pseudouridine synthase A n=1 Tax=Reichenbachiella sp. MSK19-1 TaxID=1897631 RepID=UPI000E6D2CA7|nr:tRNA pseudouridine synthase A [Reichenbachiella sp. MSK19-1]RJE72706.1 pseudouridine synthase [Reichenbachiella sp. MSK19-1]